MKYTPTKKLFSSSLFAFITLNTSFSSLACQNQPSAPEKQFCMAGAGSTHVKAEVADNLLTITLSPADLSHLLTCTKDRTSWVGRCDRCHTVRTQACTAIKLSTITFNPTHIKYEIK